MIDESHIIGVVTVLYVAVGVSHAVSGNYPWALVWCAYALANVGLMWASNK
jgi:hypothetical protein